MDAIAVFAVGVIIAHVRSPKGFNMNSPRQRRGYACREGINPEGVEHDRVIESVRHEIVTRRSA
jgi:hypothetical protein